MATTSIAQTNNAALWGRARPLAAVAFALALGYAALLRIPLLWTPIPITLQTLVLLVGAYTLGRQHAVQMALCYVGLGAVGLPFFSGGTSGAGVLAGPTGGYLVGFVAAATFIGYCRPRRPTAATVCALFLVAHGIIYSCGVAWLSRLLHLDLQAALRMGVLPFLAGDAIKCALATGLVGAWSRRESNKMKNS